MRLSVLKNNTKKLESFLFCKPALKRGKCLCIPAFLKCPLGVSETSPDRLKVLD